MALSGLLDAAPDRLEDVLSRWEKNQVKWRRFGASSSSDNGNTDSNQDASMLEDGDDLFESVQPRSETFDVTFGDGFLGLEFVFDALRNKIVIKSVQPERWTAVVMHIPPGMTITRGLSVEAVNGRDVSAMSPRTCWTTCSSASAP